MDSLSSIARRYGLSIISDAAQAFGALSRGRKIGSLGDAACFSLGRGKAVCGGEGGVLVTNDETVYKRAIALTQHPLRMQREIVVNICLPFSDELSWNYRIHPLAAVLALAELRIAEQRVAHRRLIRQTIHKKLNSIPRIKPIKCYPGDSSAAYGIPLTYFPNKCAGQTRDSFILSLQSVGIIIEAGPIRLPIHLRSTFRKGNRGLSKRVSHPSHKKGSCPVAEYRCEYQELLLFGTNVLDKIRLY
jgi:dTDP-4-amino-4,6-dideoxygalactose transaminase